MKKKITKWSFWWGLIIVFVIGYLFTGYSPSNQHIYKIPSSSKAVVVIDIHSLAKEYYRFLRFKPEEVLIFTKNKNLRSTKHPGFNLLDKLVFYIDNFDGKEIIGAVFSINSHDIFLKTVNFLDETPEVKTTENTEIHYFINNNAAAFIINGTGFFIKSINSENIMSLEFATIYYNKLFNDKNNNLFEQQRTFRESLEKKDHISIWLNSFNKYSLWLEKIISYQITKINFKTEKIILDIKTYLNTDYIIKETNNNNIELQPHESAKFSITLAPEFLKSKLHELLPHELTYLLNNWEGGICLSINGFKEHSVYYKDSSKLDLIVNLPDVSIALQMNNMNKINKQLKQDSNLLHLENSYLFNISELLNESIYLSPRKDQLIFSTVKIPENQTSYPFHTFALNISLERLLNKYPPKNLIQSVMLGYVRKFNIHNIKLTCTKKENNKLNLEGEISIGEKNQHTIKEVVSRINIPKTDK